MAEIDDLLASPEFMADPYPTYALLRAQGGPYWSEARNAWLASRWVDVDSILRNWKSFSNEGRQARMLSHLTPEQQEEVRPLRDHTLVQGLMHTDPPAHTKFRNVVKDSFAARTLELCRNNVARIVEDLIDECQAKGEFDVYRDLGLQLPTIVIAEIMGLPIEMRYRLAVLCEQFVEYQGLGRPPMEVLRRSSAAQAELDKVFSAALDGEFEHQVDRTMPGDLLRHLQEAEREGRFTREQLVNTCITILIGGHETTATLISVSVAQLLKSPDQLALLKNSNYELLPGVIAETLRFESPFQNLPRRASERVVIGDRHIQAGELVYAIVASANRDEQKFSNASVYDITRPDSRHLAFGVGVHYCLGAHLAQIEATIALRRLFERAPTLHLLEDLVWNVHKPLFRSPTSLAASF